MSSSEEEGEGEIRAGERVRGLGFLEVFVFMKRESLWLALLVLGALVDIVELVVLWLASGSGI